MDALLRTPGHGLLQGFLGHTRRLQDMNSAIVPGVKDFGTELNARAAFAAGLMVDGDRTVHGRSPLSARHPFVCRATYSAAIFFNVKVISDGAMLRMST